MRHEDHKKRESVGSRFDRKIMKTDEREIGV
jgi:hypothetical protein